MYARTRRYGPCPGSYNLDILMLMMNSFSARMMLRLNNEHPLRLSRQKPPYTTSDKRADHINLMAPHETLDRTT